MRSKWRQSVIRALVVVFFFHPLAIRYSTTKRARYTKEFVRLSPIKVDSRQSPHIAIGLSPFLHSLGQRREYFLLIADVKAKTLSRAGPAPRNVSLYCV